MTFWSGVIVGVMIVYVALFIVREVKTRRGN